MSPVGIALSSTFTFENSMRIPAPPLVVTFMADPSGYIHVQDCVGNELLICYSVRDFITGVSRDSFFFFPK